MRIQRGLMAPMVGPLIWHTALDAVEALERANPSVAKRAGDMPQLEYPRRATTGHIHWPARDLAIAAKLGNPKSNLAARVSEFGAEQDRSFDRFFP